MDRVVVRVDGGKCMDSTEHVDGNFGDAQEQRKTSDRNSAL